MALVEQGWNLSVNLLGTDNRTVTRQYELRKTVYADLGADITAILEKLADVTNAAITGYTLSQRWFDETITTPGLGVGDSPALLTDVAQITVRLVDGTAATITVPAPEIGIFQSAGGAGRNIVQIDDTKVTDYVGLFQETGGLCNLSDGEQVKDGAGAIISGKRSTNRLTS